MSEESIYEITRRAAAAVTRRHSFLLLSGAAGAAAAPITAEAGDAAKKVRRRCRRQKAQCQASVEEHCGASSGCVDNLLPCCEALATCNASASTECFLSRLTN